MTKDDPPTDPFDLENLRLPERLILTPGAAAKAEQMRSAAKISLLDSH